MKPASKNGALKYGITFDGVKINESRPLLLPFSLFLLTPLTYLQWPTFI